jgi:hypothetical protein
MFLLSFERLSSPGRNDLWSDKYVFGGGSGAWDCSAGRHWRAWLLN